jgi:sulfatase maturation enzyme AslB (radical SAM superfamily)
MIDKIQPYEIVVCIGTGSMECDTLTQKIASNLNMPYHRILDSDTYCRPGIYHTSVYDIRLSELKEKLERKNAKIMMLNVPASSYRTPDDYADTMLMFNTLSQILSTEKQPSTDNQWYFDQMKTNKAFCIIPFTGVWQSNNGGKHCCHMPEIWQGNIPKFFDQRSQDIRAQILQGNRVPECQFCYDLDDNQGHSDRISWTYRYGSKLNLFSKKDLQANTAIKQLHLQLDNQCNLLCRMCDPKFSNLIAKEYEELGLYKKTEIKSNQNNLFDLIDLTSLESLTVTGGEPTINEKFLNFLQTCTDEKKHTLEIMISTNAASFNKSLKTLIGQFSRMKFGVSLDGFAGLNYYIRWPAMWEKVEKNIEFLQYQKKLSHFNTTVNIYNINRLYDLYHWIDRQYPDTPVGMNFVSYPKQLIPWHCPDRSQIVSGLDKIKKLRIYQINQVLKDNIAYIENKLDTWKFDQNLLIEFYNFSDLLDKKRGVFLKDYNSELDQYRYNLI